MLIVSQQLAGSQTSRLRVRVHGLIQRIQILGSETPRKNVARLCHEV
jgi:hypothetical protein